MLLTGADAAAMKLELYNKENKLLCNLDNDSAMLGSYPVEDGFRLHVSSLRFFFLYRVNPLFVPVFIMVN